MKKWLKIGGIVGAVALVGAVAFGGAVAFAQNSFGPRGFGEDGGFGRGGQSAFADQGFGQRGFGEDGERSRGEGGPRNGRGMGGEVTAIGDGTLTLENRDGESVTVNLDDETKVILVETQSEGSVSDIAVGNQVKVRGQRNDDGSIDARGVMVAPEGDRAGGKVSAVDGSTITVEKRDGETTTITTNDSTVIRLGRDGTGTLEDVTTDKVVMAFGETQEDGNLEARLLFVGEPGRGHRGGGPGGEVTAIDGTSFTIETRRGDTLTVLTDDETEYRTRGDQEVSFDDIAVGGMVKVKGERVDGQENTIQADMIGIKIDE